MLPVSPTPEEYTTTMVNGKEPSKAGNSNVACFNPLTPEDFHVFEWFSAFTRPIGFRDSIFKVTIESAAVLKH